MMSQVHLLRKRKNSEGVKAIPREERLRKQFRLAITGVLLISGYLTGLVEVLLFNLPEGFAPQNVLRALFASKASLLLFPLTATILSCIVISAVRKTWEESQREDRLKTTTTEN